MNERPKEPRSCQSFEVRAWLRKSSPNALDASYPEVMADKGIQRDPPRDDVPSRLLPRKVDRVEDFCFNQRQLVAAPRPAESATTVVVTIALQATPRHCTGGRNPHEWPFGVGCRQDRLDPTMTRILPVRLLDRKPHIESSEQPSLFDRASGGKRVARIVERPGGRAEHHDCVITVRRAHPCNPVAGPVERARVRDRHQTEISLREPLLEEQHRLVLRRRRRYAEHDSQTLPHFLLVLRHTNRLPRPPNHTLAWASSGMSHEGVTLRRGCRTTRWCCSLGSDTVAPDCPNGDERGVEARWTHTGPFARMPWSRVPVSVPCPDKCRLPVPDASDTGQRCAVSPDESQAGTPNI